MAISCCLPATIPPRTTRSSMPPPVLTLPGDRRTLVQLGAVLSSYSSIACQNNTFPRAKLARHLRCAALAMVAPSITRQTTQYPRHMVWCREHTIIRHIRYVSMGAPHACPREEYGHERTHCRLQGIRQTL